MGTLSIVVLTLAALFIALMIGMNVYVRIRARAMNGKPLPALPGGVGTSISRAKNGLVYFMTPSCGACRAITPKMSALAKKNKNVFVIDVSENLELARALRIMATPSTIEIDSGRVVNVHIGMIPPDLLQRYAS